MALITNKVVVKAAEDVKPEPVAKPSRPVITDANISRVKGTKLVVDGKVKNISKKSAFLLDMISLDDE